MEERLPAQHVDAGHDRPRRALSPLSSVTVDVVIPVLNEERALPGCVAVLHEFLAERLPFNWSITIVDSASTDGTRLVAKRLARQWSRVRVVCLDRRGKGNGGRAARARSRAGGGGYMERELAAGP